MNNAQFSAPRGRSLWGTAVASIALAVALSPALTAQQVMQQSGSQSPSTVDGSVAAQLKLTNVNSMRLAIWSPEGVLVPGARVSVVSPGGITGKSEELVDGTYVLEGLGEKARIEIEHFDYGSAAFEVLVPNRGEMINVFFHGLDHAEIDADTNGTVADDRGVAPPGPPANDDCSSATPLSMPSLTNGSTLGGTIDVAPFCGTGITAPGVWYSVIGNGNQFFAQTCGPLFGYDTKLSVYTDGCGTLTCVTGNDDNCAGGASTLLSTAEWTSDPGVEYLILVHGFGSAAGDFLLTLSQAVPPAGDTCDDATPLNVPDFTTGTTVGAGVDSDFDTCGTPISAPGVWYSITGTGSTITVSTCNASTDYDSKISVYCASCDEPTCVGGNDDNCDPMFGSLLSTFSFCSEAGAQYFILVHGFSTASGNFGLTITDDGVPCDGAVACTPTGACCLPGDQCVDGLTADECAAAGGVYQGDGSACAGDFVGYDIALSGNGFEDISGSGAAGPAGDDASLTVPLGFAFSFFGDSKTEITMSTNGYLTFDPLAGTDFSNDPCPDSFAPNDAIFPLWDDFNLNDGGSTSFETQGAAPNRRFIAQWTDAAEFGSAGSDTATFQAVLNEDGSIEFRYDTLVRVPTGPGDATIGLENADGSIGSCIPDSLAKNGSAYVWTPEFVNPVDCCETLDFETDDGGNALSNGQDINVGDEFGNLVNISGEGGANNGAAIYDSDTGGGNDPGGADPNLIIDQGNVLILQDVDSALQTVPGTFDTPNDAGGGGTLVFDFLVPVYASSVDLIDIDPGYQDASVTLIDGSGNERFYDVPNGWTADQDVGTLDLTTLAAQAGVSSVATASEDAGFDDLDVVRIEIFMRSSGAVDNLRICP